MEVVIGIVTGMVYLGIPIAIIAVAGCLAGMVIHGHFSKGSKSEKH